MNCAGLLVSVSLLSALVACSDGQKVGDDLVVLKTGDRQTGTLHGCINASCQLDNQAIPQVQIAWIGFSYANSPPPSVDNPATDEIHARGGWVESGRLVGISVSKVVTEKRAYDRPQVAWIHLGPAPPRPPLPGEMRHPEIKDSGKGEDDAGTRNPPSPLTSPPPTSPPSTSRTPTPPGSRPPTSDDTCNFWVGDVRSVITVKIGSVANHFSGHEISKTTYHLRLREGDRSHPASLDIPLINAGSLVEGSEDFQDNGQKGYGFAGSARNSGSGKVPVLDPGTNSGAVGRIKLTGTGERAQYHFEMWPDSESSFFPTTKRDFSGDPSPRESVSESTGTFRSVSIGESSDPQSPRVFIDGGMSMEGNYTITFSDRGSTTTSWSLRAVTAACVRPRDLGGDPPAASDDRCPPPTSQLALLNKALDEERALRTLIGKQYEEIRQLQQQAKQWQNDFDQAARDCNLWQVAQALTNLLVGNEKTAAGAAGKELSNFLSWLDKVSNGDPSWLLPNTEFKEYFSAEDAWEGFQAAYGQIAPASQAEALLKGLRSCGSPTGSGVMEGAVNYLRLLQQIEPKAQAAQKTLNDIRSKDQQVFDLENAYRKACIDRAKCQGTDPALCAAPPPPE